MQKLSQRFICKVFFGYDTSVDLISYLKQMGFNDDLRQSILLGIVQPSGISSLINYNLPTNNNIRFPYYLYRIKEEELIFQDEKINKMISLPSLSKGTHICISIYGCRCHSEEL
ncbi:unnamed protein product [Rotaria magnacalcarata]|uniref:Uncharacterized protein n=2 Tax=Rotaria magnacalcarata TaxID=392030 RepID=A0A816QI36_9BILA|nr:unnamed protein product [Rotaria magnacalcarata]CAF1980149.1 unnamed protein product [Rotaria magnacalcarata]CAF2060099.1 unnamed protein product [Rotaria magnacalcarata]CAF3756017.1 unnamed protein product [Rotaria magnacalcarata]CAF3797642.1 unnamed protein product [Rotaria magnacalcarata]